LKKILRICNERDVWAVLHFSDITVHTLNNGASGQLSCYENAEIPNKEGYQRRHQSNIDLQGGGRWLFGLAGPASRKTGTKNALWTVVTCVLRLLYWGRETEWGKRI
jgi:hypothetical protein